jgi:hypothetical protein
LATSPAFAEWELESENKPSGVSTYATTFWLQGYGSINLDNLVRMEDRVDEGTYWSTLMLSCVRKKLIIGINLNVAGSGNREIVLDDPGFAYLRFNSSAQRRYKTYGTDLESSISFTAEARNIVAQILKSKSLSVTLKDRNSRDKISMIFDVTGLSKAKTRFRYAGCKI